MSNKGLVFVIVILLLVIAGLSWYMFSQPTVVSGPAPTPTPAPSPTPTASTRPIVSAPLFGATVGASFAVTGTAPGPWYFEASFPIQVRDKDNNKIGQAIAQAQGDWMTTDMVPFTAYVSTAGYTGEAILVLLKDNPSGMPELDDAIEIPILIQ